MEFIETPIFTKQIQALLEDEDYCDLQAVLAGHPKTGDAIPGGHGLRKIRWHSPQRGRGKRGGVRVIYYCLSHRQIIMIFAYDKSKQGDLTKQQLKILSGYAKEKVL